MIYIRYYKDIILEEDMDISQIKELFSQGKAIYNIYAVCISEKTNGLMEIMSSENLLKMINSYGNYGIIALVKGRENAKNKSVELINNWLENHSDLCGFKGHYNINCF